MSVIRQVFGEWLKSLPPLFTVSSVRNAIIFLVGGLVLTDLLTKFIGLLLLGALGSSQSSLNIIAMVVVAGLVLFAIVLFILETYLTLRSLMYATFLGFAAYQQPQLIAHIKVPSFKKSFVLEWCGFIYTLPYLLIYYVLPVLVMYVAFIYSLPSIVLMFILISTVVSMVYGGILMGSICLAACATPYEQLSYKTAVLYGKYVIRLAGFKYMIGVSIAGLVICAFSFLYLIAGLGVYNEITLFIYYLLRTVCRCFFIGLTLHWSAFSYAYVLRNETEQR